MNRSPNREHRNHTVEEPLATVIVVPRERFSLSISSLRNIYENISIPFSLVYVDGGSPASIKEQLAKEATGRGFKLIRSDKYLFPNQARNIGLEHATTRYVVFIDNDVYVAPGWLEALVQCAEETEAAAVGPLYFQGQIEERVIHMAGGLAHICEEDGRRVCHVEDFLEHQRFDDIQEPLLRQETELLEFHCMLVRRSVFDRIGTLDEGFKNTREHIDFCMTLRTAGEKIFLEPKAQAAYRRPPPFAFSDLPFFMLRWGEAWTRTTLEHYHHKWNLQIDETDHTLSWTKKQRYRFLEPYLSKFLGIMFKILGRARTRRLIQVTLFPLEGIINRLFIRVPQNSRNSLSKPDTSDSAQNYFL